MAKTPTDQKEKEIIFNNGNDNEEEEVVEDRKIQKIAIRVVNDLGSRNASSSCTCQADECGVDLRLAKNYNRRHRVCERHAKAPVVLISSTRQRFCQQCSKFHELAEFDDTKRSCRVRLAGHNERRRKSHLMVEEQPHSD